MKCDHSSLITSPEWEEVCLLCGEVVDVIPWSKVEIDEIHYGEIQRHLEDVIANAHIFSSIIQPTLYQYKFLRQNSKLNGFSKLELLCYSLYCQLLEENSGRTVRELCYFFEIDSKKIWKIIKTMNNSCELNPDQLIARFSEELNIPYSYNIKILHILQQLVSISSAKPQTLAAASILIYCNEKSHKIDKNVLCKVADITWPSIRCLIKKYLNKE